MHLDATDPRNYYFRATDAIIKNTVDLGMKIFYRLGTSIEQNTDAASEHNNSLVPENFDQYAEVMAGIVRHYTRGWANGFHYDIRYWEIWNEPELGTQTWCGTQQEFMNLFVTVFKRLKSEFPELKIGGPAFTVPVGNWPEAFMKACKSAGIVPDFYSCHGYTNNPEKLINRADDARRILDEYGFTGTEVSINEWHYKEDESGVLPNAQRDLVRYTFDGPLGHYNIQSAVFNLAVLIGWQDKPVDTACYYGSGINGCWGYQDKEQRWNKVFYSMRMFGEVISQYTDKVQCWVAPRTVRNIYALGGFSAKHDKAVLLLADYGGTEGSTISLEVVGLENGKCVGARILDNDNDLLPCAIYRHGNILTVAKNAPGSATWLIEFAMEN